MDEKLFDIVFYEDGYMRIENIFAPISSIARVTFNEHSHFDFSFDIEHFEQVMRNPNTYWDVTVYLNNGDFYTGGCYHSKKNAMMAAEAIIKKAMPFMNGRQHGCKIEEI